MSIKHLLAGAALAVTVAGAAAANAEIVNGSFETGNTAGWSGGFASTNEYGYTATDGVFLGSTYAGCGVDNPCTVSQTFTTVGGLFSGDAAFLAHDYMPYNDWAFVNLFDGVNTTNLFYSDVSQVGDYGSTPWTHFSINLAPGAYTVTFGVANHLDNSYSSQIVADHFVSGGGAPEPAAWALMIGGFGLAGATLRRRKAVLA